MLPDISSENSFIKHKVPSGKTIGVGGWRVKEEKELLFALEVEQDIEDNKIKHIINLLRDCVDDKNKFKTLSETDLIKVAIEARKLAKGDIIEYNYTCPKCGNKFFDEVNITKEQVVEFFDLTPLVVNENMTVTFKDLDWVKVEELYKASDSEAKFAFKMIIYSIDSITYKGITHTEFTPDEVEVFIGQLKSADMKIITDGYESRLSSCTLERKIKCIKCKEDIDINFGDFLSFLVL